MSYRMVLIGAGAIGGITAAFLTRAGEDLTVVCKTTELRDLLRKEGLHITGVRGDLHVPVRAECMQDLEGTFDACLIATKSYDMPDCARRMLPHLRDDSLVVSMQNGICTDQLAGIVSPERTVGCVIGFGATLLGPGRMEMTSTGAFVIGRSDGGATPGLTRLARALSHVTDTRVSESIEGELYSKMIVNACITSLGAVCGLRLGPMMNRPLARRIFLAVIGEAVAVARTRHLTLPPYAGRLDYDKLMRGNTPLDTARRHLTIWAVGLKYRRLKSSSLQSLERGRPTEVDAFNGYIASQGRTLGVPTQVCDCLTRMIHEEEDGKRAIGVRNLREIPLA